jgi:hypothetical protein
MLQFLLHHFLRDNANIRRSRKYRRIMLVKASTQITQPFAEAENKTLLLFVNVKQEKYDSSLKQVKLIGFSVFNISCFP